MPITGSGLDHLSVGEEVDELPEGIFCADWDGRIYKTPRMIRFPVDGVIVEGQLLNLEIHIDYDRSTATHIALVVSNEIIASRMTFSFETDRLFELLSNEDPTIFVTSLSRDVPLIDFLNEHPLCFYTEDLGLLRGFDLVLPSTRPEILFEMGAIEAISWEAHGIDPMREYGPSSIHHFIEQKLVGGNADVVYYDDGPGEVADFIAVTQQQDMVLVELLHCKGCGRQRRRRSRGRCLRGMWPSGKVGDLDRSASACPPH